jgi:hypothetical protein
MKVNEVPQDKGFLIEGRISDLCYALDDDGNYRQTISTGWAPKNDAMQYAWDTIYENARINKEKIIAGQLSPIAFYMVLNAMDIDILASYIGFSRRKVKRHLKMKVFMRQNSECIAKYAELFGLKPHQLMNIEFLKNVNLDGENNIST